ncbi:MAG: anaerobic ribonucleoside-triphosphate reductase activating protein [Spirochaetales bacterium]|nr:anaerobic ribonucleoside-triphosphate reductase activating protein [Spirochaetales bacterium]
MLIGGIHRFSLIDFPKKIACTVFTLRCNLRCHYCHNPELVDPAQHSERMLPELFFDFLQDRHGKLDGVVITGGEPTLQPDLPEFCKKIKDMGFLVKLDTNGTNSEMLTQLVREKLVDYIAMDIKAPLEKYREVTGVSDTAITAEVQKSLTFMSASSVQHEFRTTVVKGLLSEKDIMAIGDLLQDNQTYILQKFAASQTLCPAYADAEPFSDETIDKLCKKLLKNGVKAFSR